MLVLERRGRREAWENGKVRRHWPLSVKSPDNGVASVTPSYVSGNGQDPEGYGHSHKAPRAEQTV